MSRKTHPITEQLQVLFGARFGRELGQAGWAAMRKAVHEPTDPLGEALPSYQRERLHALVRLCELFYPEQDPEPERIQGAGDVVRFYADRCLTLRERVLWLLCLESSGAIAAEVLVQIGGERMSAPSVKTLLRHAIAKDAAVIYIADCRCQTLGRPDAPTIAAFQKLVAMGEEIGITVADYLFLTRYATALSLVEYLARQEEPLALAA